MTLKHVLKHFSKTEVQEDKTHPCPPLKREGVNVLCAELTVKDLSSNRLIVLTTFKKAAFTLAEVLITLGIIGVVAALTLPTLIKNYQKQVYVNQLKVAYSTLEQGFKKMLADEGVDSLWDIPEFANDCYVIGDNTSTNCVALTNKLQKYFKFTIVQYDDIPEDLEISFLGSSETDIYRDLISGSILIFPNNFFIAMFPDYLQASNLQLTKDLGGHLTESCAYIWLDINGYKGPNKYGRDVFHFTLGSDGILYPNGGADFALFYEQTPLESNTRYWRTSPSCDTDVLGGGVCAARIMEEGWKMNY